MDIVLCMSPVKEMKKMNKDKKVISSWDEWTALSQNIKNYPEKYEGWTFSQNHGEEMNIKKLVEEMIG